jgi:hypothetical protein
MTSAPLPEPTDLPAYDEEAFADPFGQRARWLRESTRRACELALRLAERAHGRGGAVMLPGLNPGAIDLDLRPWRSAVRCAPPESGTASASAEAIATAFSTEGVEILPSASLDLAQRTLLCQAADGRRIETEEWELAAELFEELGYLLLSRTFNRERLERAAAEEPLRFFFKLGELVARMHEKGVLHGDIHPANFGWQDGQVVIIDAGSVRFEDRRLEACERAADVGLLKLTVSFAEWEAVKLGYRTAAADGAEPVLELLGG